MDFELNLIFNINAAIHFGFLLIIEQEEPFFHEISSNVIDQKLLHLLLNKRVV